MMQKVWNMFRTKHDHNDDESSDETSESEKDDAGRFTNVISF